MDRANKREVVIALERRILRLLCSGELREPGSAGLLSDLASHTWRQAEHQIVWEALLRVPEGSVVLRQVLPTEAARMGFPDVEWSDYFSGWSRRLNANDVRPTEGAEGNENSAGSVVMGSDSTDLGTLVQELKELIEE
jgi:hypothetical protein